MQTHKSLFSLSLSYSVKGWISWDKLRVRWLLMLIGMPWPPVGYIKSGVGRFGRGSFQLWLVLSHTHRQTHEFGYVQSLKHCMLLLKLLICYLGVHWYFYVCMFIFLFWISFLYTFLFTDSVSHCADKKTPQVSYLLCSLPLPTLRGNGSFVFLRFALVPTSLQLCFLRCPFSYCSLMLLLAHLMLPFYVFVYLLYFALYVAGEGWVLTGATRGRATCGM